MTRVHSIAPKGTSERYSEAVEKLHSPGDYVLVVRGQPRTIVMVCPDGCGENITINLDRRTGKAWRKYETEEKLTIYPSVWRDTGCRAHFIVWKDRIIWCGVGDSLGVNLDETLVARVFSKLSAESYTNFESIADDLKLIPWEALWACKELKRRNRCVEGDKGAYRRVGSTGSPPAVSGHINILA